MKIYLISCSNELMLQVKCATKEQEIDFFLNLLCWLKHLKLDANNHLVCNVLFMKDDTLLRKVQGFCDSPRGGNGKIAELYRFVEKVKDGGYFVFIPVADDGVLNEEDHIKMLTKLASLDSGANQADLIWDFNSFKEKLSGYFDVIAIYDANSVKTYIGHKNLEDRKCRFCCKSIKHGDGRFDKEAHAISEFLGNKNIILCDECDECNGTIFARLEAELAKYLSPLKALMSIKGKHGFASHAECGLSVNTISSGHIAVKIDENNITKQENNEFLKIGFNASCGNIILQDVYKIFSKYAISVLSDNYFQRDEFKVLLEWIISDKYVEKLPLVCTHSNGTICNEPKIAIYRRIENVNDTGIPKYLCELNIVATRYLYELPLIEAEICFDSVKKWQEFLNKVRVFGGEMNNSYIDFSGQDRVPRYQHIVLEGRKCTNEGSVLQVG